MTTPRRIAPVLLCGALLLPALTACGSEEKTFERASAAASTPAGSGSAAASSSPSVSVASPAASGGVAPSQATTPSVTQSSTPSVTPSASPSAASTDPGQWRSWRLTTAGWGPVKIGQPVPEALRSSFTPAWECMGPMFKAEGKDVVMVFTSNGQLSGSVTTISIQSTATSTQSGLTLGDSTKKMFQFFPDIYGHEPYHHPATGRSWGVDQLGDGPWSIYFESDAEVIKHISVQADDKGFQPIGAIGPCGAP